MSDFEQVAGVGAEQRFNVIGFLQCMPDAKEHEQDGRQTSEGKVLPFWSSGPRTYQTL